MILFLLTLYVSRLNNSLSIHLFVIPQFLFLILFSFFLHSPFPQYHIFLKILLSWSQPSSFYCSKPSHKFSTHSFLKYVETISFCYLAVCLPRCLTLNSLQIVHFLFYFFWFFLLYFSKVSYLP